MVFVKGLDVRKEKAEAKEGAQDRKYAKDTKRVQSSELSRTDWPKLLRTAKKVVLRLWSKLRSDLSRRGTGPEKNDGKERERKRGERRESEHGRARQRCRRACLQSRPSIRGGASIMIILDARLPVAAAWRLTTHFHHLPETLPT